MSQLGILIVSNYCGEETGFKCYTINTIMHYQCCLLTIIFTVVVSSRTTSPMISWARVLMKFKRSLFAGTSGIVNLKSLDDLGGGLTIMSSSNMKSPLLAAFFTFLGFIRWTAFLFLIRERFELLPLLINMFPGCIERVDEPVCLGILLVFS